MQEKTPPNDSIAVDKNNKTGMNAPRSLGNASRAALYNIGKVLNYEEQIEAPNKCNDEYHMQPSMMYMTLSNILVNIIYI